jgi:hypothetical protein
MEGIVILETFEYGIDYVVTGFGIPAAFALGVICAIAGILVGLCVAEVLYNFIYKKFRIDVTGLIVVVTMIVMGIIGFVIGGFTMPHREPSDYETRYKVVLTEDVGYKEFTEKYEIIDFEDNIYTVREKE